MLRFIRRRDKAAATDAASASDDVVLAEGEQSSGEEQVGSLEVQKAETTGGTSDEDPGQEQGGLFARFAAKVNRTGQSFGAGMGRILLGKKEIDDELLEDIETQLLVADVGIDTTRSIMDQLAQSIERDALTDSDALYDALKVALKQVLAANDETFVVDCNHQPYVILVVGVNGAGKTTTIGKLARRFQSSGLDVMLAAGDTFRAAAVEQLKAWGERNDVPVVAQDTGSDSASVIYDALESARSRGTDVLIADTAGRLHNKDNLMEELKKVVRVMGKIDGSAPHEVLLVLDATTGQNAIAQASSFQQAVGVTGIAVTKLDGTAKGGVLFAISEQLGLPIRFIGVGEQVEDLRPFNAEEFVDAIFAASS